MRSHLHSLVQFETDFHGLWMNICIETKEEGARRLKIIGYEFSLIDYKTRAYWAIIDIKQEYVNKTLKTITHQCSSKRTR